MAEICKYCGKKLSKYTYGVTTPIDAPAPEKVWDTKPVVEVISRRPPTYTSDTHDILSVWCGEWGYMGRGSFCTKTCGWRWALREVQR